MRAVLQRVEEASVSVNRKKISEIGVGLVVLLGISKDDTSDDVRYLVERVLNLRIFPNSDNQFDRSALDTKAELLIVSQFTLYASTRKGRRPNFTNAASPEEAESLYHRTVEMFTESGLRIATGQFGEYMAVNITNDGPVTLVLNSADRLSPRRS